MASAGRYTRLTMNMGSKIGLLSPGGQPRE